jgi:hypothetical protein
MGTKGLSRLRFQAMLGLGLGGIYVSRNVDTHTCVQIRIISICMGTSARCYEVLELGFEATQRWRLYVPCLRLILMYSQPTILEPSHLFVCHVQLRTPRQCLSCSDTFVLVFFSFLSCPADNLRAVSIAAPPHEPGSVGASDFTGVRPRGVIWPRIATRRFGTCIYISRHIHTYTYMYIHTHTHTYIYTYPEVSARRTLRACVRAGLFDRALPLADLVRNTIYIS